MPDEDNANSTPSVDGDEAYDSRHQTRAASLHLPSSQCLFFFFYL